MTKIPELRGRSIGSDRVRLGADDARSSDFWMILLCATRFPACRAARSGLRTTRSASPRRSAAISSMHRPPATACRRCLTANASVDVAALQEGRVVRRAISMHDFIVGPGLTALGKNEILVGIEAEATPDYGGAFEKVGHRRSLVISVACVSALVKLDASGAASRMCGSRLAASGRCRGAWREIEDALRGAGVGAQAIASAGRISVDYVRSRSRVEYRRAVLPGLIGRAVTAAARGGRRRMRTQ